ncbi:MAG: squalene/phytoene synthase family protein [Planctomycetaceae bacterium]|jgi:phytoene/squalene synthetase|nr:squalene/phytoene synthase family protein [Planctomycetaceae bacterium]
MLNLSSISSFLVEERVYSLSEAAAYCRRKTWGHYENFSVASFLLPRELRVPMEAVYSYCRHADDLGDENDGSEIARMQSIEKLNQWERELNLCFDYAQSDLNELPIMHPIFVALIDVIRKFHLSKEPFTDLLIAFRQDQIKRRYESTDELLSYCCNSANPVGRIVLHLAFVVEKQRMAGVKTSVELSSDIADSSGEIRISQEVLTLSDYICTGLQLANFWQDIKRDLAIGRCYIPRDVASKYGVDIENLGYDTEFRLMMKELVEDAREKILAGLPLLSEVPKLIKFNISLIIRGGLAILDGIKKIEYNVLNQRPIVSGLKKLTIAFKAFFSG